MFKVVMAVSLIGNTLLGWHLLCRVPPEPVKHLPQRSRSVLGNVSTKSPAPWAHLETSSPERLAANLRSIGCPEHLIHNAVVAEINRSYQRRADALKRRPEFWSTHDARVAEEQAYGLAFWDLDRERRAELLQKTGSAITPRKNWHGDKAALLNAFTLGYLGPEALEQVAPIVQDARQQGNDFGRIAEAMDDEEALRERELLYEKYEESISRYLSPSERFRVESFYFEMDLFDVWSDEQQFGRKLSDDERRTLIGILMPPDYIQHHFFNLPLMSEQDEAFQEARLNALRETFDDVLVDHYIRFKQR